MPQARTPQTAGGPTARRTFGLLETLRSRRDLVGADEFELAAAASRLVGMPYPKAHDLVRGLIAPRRRSRPVTGGVGALSTVGLAGWIA